MDVNVCQYIAQGKSKWVERHLHLVRLEEAQPYNCGCERFLLGNPLLVESDCFALFSCREEQQLLRQGVTHCSMTASLAGAHAT